MIRRQFAKGLAVACAALLAPLPLRAAEGDPAAVVGTWSGPWYLGMTSGVARLALTGDGVLRGTLQMTNNEKFGEAEVPLAQAALDGNLVRFKATGADGRVLVAELPLAADGTRMKGLAKYGGYNVRFELTRQK